MNLRSFLSDNGRARRLLLLLCLTFSSLMLGCGNPRSRVVLYCAQDREFAEELLSIFSDRTSLRVDPKYDTEGGKSVVLYQEILTERDRPRCDAFWNNEILSTIRLQRQGLLEPYASRSAEHYPESCRPTDDTWHAFAARARVLIVNTELVPSAERPRSFLDLTQPKWRGRVAMGKPNHSTSATQAACLFEVLGAERAEQYYHDLRSNGLQVAPGNKQVAEWVGEAHLPGRRPIAVGVTDTDDALEEVAAGHPVEIIFPDADGSPDNPRIGTLFIPNTVCIIRGCPNLDAARRLVDYLLSDEVETKLAEGGGHQIPMNPSVHAVLPPQIKTPAQVKAMQVDFYKAADLWERTQTFLRKEFETPGS